MFRKPKPPLERAARALCRHEGLPENIMFEDRPMWESYLPKARAVLMALQEGATGEEWAMIEGWLP
jgi:hypothetical protein